MVSLPLETIEETIDYLWDDPGVLRCCALVNSALLHRARGHLFHTVTLTAPELYQHFSELMASSSAVGNYVRRLILGNRIDAIIRPILCKLTCIQFIVISERRSWAYLDQDVRDTLISASKLPSLSSVAIAQSIDPSHDELSLAQCPKLEHLSLRAMMRRDAIVLPKDTAPINLKSLRLIPSYSSPSGVFPSTAGERLFDLTELQSLELKLQSIPSESSFPWLRALDQLGGQWNKLTTLCWFPTSLDMEEFGGFSALQSMALLFIFNVQTYTLEVPSVSTISLNSSILAFKFRTIMLEL